MSVPASETFLQLTYSVSIGLEFPAMYSAMSAQKRLAVTVFPVPTPPVRYAEHALPDIASGLNSVSSLASWASRCTRFLGTNAKSRTDPSRITADFLSNMIGSCCSV